jgi:tripartite ATP-independent transporter DctP family solute receptor
MSSVLPPAFAWGRASELWSKLIRDNSGGRINAKVYPGASLVQGDATRELTGIRQGSIDLVCGAPGNWSGSARELGCFSLPFLFPDHKALDAVLQNRAFMAQYFDAVRKAGAEPLAVGETGFRQLCNSKLPIRTVADLRGLKLRIVPSPMMSDVFTELGANPTVMSWADTQPALSSGAVDGCENPMELFFAAKMHTLGQKYVTRWNYMNEILLFAVSRSTWESWSAADQKAVRDAAQDAAKSNIAEVRKFYAEDLSRAKEVGVEVYEPSSAELSTFQQSTRRSYNKWKSQINPALVSAIEQIVETSRKA